MPLAALNKAAKAALRRAMESSTQGPNPSPPSMADLVRVIKRETGEEVTERQVNSALWSMNGHDGFEYTPKQSRPWRKRQGQPESSDAGGSEASISPERHRQKKVQMSAAADAALLEALANRSTLDTSAGLRPALAQYIFEHTSPPEIYTTEQVWSAMRRLEKQGRLVYEGAGTGRGNPYRVRRRREGEGQPMVLASASSQAPHPQTEMQPYQHSFPVEPRSPVYEQHPPAPHYTSEQPPSSPLFHPSSSPPIAPSTHHYVYLDSQGAEVPADDVWQNHRGELFDARGLPVSVHDLGALA